jgi:uncharacterized protein (DUF1501 family)
MMKLNRREFLKLGAGSLLPLTGIADLAFAGESGDKPLLVVVFLRGGADGLHLLAPVDDADYVGARLPEMRVLDSGERPGWRLAQSLAPALDFRLHYEAAPLAHLYEARRLQFWHAVGLTDGTRSHFVAQDLMERGIADEKRLASVNDGWLGRSAQHAEGAVPLLSATAAPVFALRGQMPVFATPDLAAGSSLPWGAATTRLLNSLYAAGSSPVHVAGQGALALLERIDRKLPKDGQGKVQPYRPEGKASYDGSGDLARSLSTVARLAKMELGLSAACVDFGGWDTHENQPGRFASQVRQLSLGLAAFHDDMAASGRKTVTLVMSEFGRRLRANKSNGTDHGHGACWLVMGDGVDGGNLRGRWPGLATSQLDQGVDLAVTTDYRKVLAEVLATAGFGVPKGLVAAAG